MQNLQVGSAETLSSAEQEETNHSLEPDESSADKKSLVVFDAPRQAASASTTQVQLSVHAHFPPRRPRRPFLTAPVHSPPTQYGASVALLPTISTMPQRPSAADWTLISGALPSPRSAGVSLPYGTP